MKTSRLRRVFLIDGKTSGTVSSGMICQIDPCGGAAITGENGVGKTTSLQLIPLFFGCAPSRLVHPGSTVEPMLQFMLPHDTSAIAFEYQRGDAPEDLRLVVIRRQSGGQAAEYRLFGAGFREELFFGPSLLGATEEVALLDDERSVRAAAALGIVVEGKLNGAEYKHVILRTRAQTREAQKLKKLAETYSYSERSLGQLDKIMSAMVREKFEFREFLAVVESIVYEAVGNQGRLVLKDMRAQMERWLTNRDACARADRMAGEIKGLRGNLEAHGQQRSQLRRLRADVRALAKLIEQRAAKAKVTLERLQSDRRMEVEQERAQAATLSQALAAARETLTKVETQLRTLQARDKYLQDERASYWAEQIGDLDSVQAQLGQVATQIRLTESTAEGIAREIEEALAQLQTQSAEQLNQIEESKAAPNSQYSAAIAKLTEDAGHDREQLHERQRVETAQREDALGTLRGRRTEAKTLSENVVVPPELAQQLDDADHKYETMREAAAGALKALETCREATRVARSEFERAERSNELATTAVAAARATLESIRAAQTPAPGTLLAALRGSGDAAWASNLARVIDPSLRDRADLQPLAPAEGDACDTLFGWKIDTSVLATPAWADEARLAAEIAQQQERVEQTEQARRHAEEALARASQGLKDAGEQEREAQAAHSISAENTRRQDLLVKQLRQDCARARTTAREQHLRTIADLDEHIKRAERELADLRTLHKETRDKFESLLQQSLREQKGVLDSALEEINRRKQSHVEATRRTAEELRAQIKSRLKEAGVDTEKLDELKARQSILKDRQAELSGKQALVALWRSWLDEDGPAQLMQLELDASAQRTEIGRGEASERAMKKAFGEKQTAFEDASDSLEKDVRQAGLDLADLQRLDEVSLKDFEVPAGTISAVTEDIAVSDLAGQIQKALRVHEQQVTAMSSQVQSLMQRLTNGSNAVSELVNRYVNEELAGQDYTITLKAMSLCDVYERIPRDVVEPLNTELGTILETLETFKNRINDYERAVREFNRSLQTGIESVVSTFERLKDFEIHVITTFEKVGFIKQLDDLSDIVREHRNRSYLTSNRDLPPETTAQKLKSVLSVIGDGSLEVNLGQYITLYGSANDAGNIKKFHNEESLQRLSSTGITAIAMITLMTGMLNVVRGDSQIYIPWATDEVGRFDPGNFARLMEMLHKNRIDVVTASPQLTASAYSMFAHRYLFWPQSEWSIFESDLAQLEEINRKVLAQARAAAAQQEEVAS